MLSYTKQLTEIDSRKCGEAYDVHVPGNHCDGKLLFGF